MTGNTDMASTEEENEPANTTKQILSFLKNGETKIKIRHVPYNEVVLVLGLTGSGKSTFTQFVTGNNHLEARENGKDTGEFSVIDTSPNPKVCASTIDSCTTLPDLVVDSATKTAFYDCPGFSDTRSAVHDISVTYFINKVLDSADAVKMVFTVNYPSVQRGMDRQNFMQLMRNALNLIKDVNHFASSIALVVTKVDNRVVFRKGLPVLVSDNAIIDGIASFLEEIQENLKNKIATKVDPDEEQFYTRAVELLTVLLKKDGANYSRIGLFRRPNEAGVLTELDLLQRNKKNLEKIIHQNLNFGQSSREYFGHTISAESKNHLHDIVEEMNLNIASAVAGIGEKIIQKAKDHERSLKGAEEIFSRSRLGYNLLHKLKTSDFSGPRALMENLVRVLNELNVKVATKDVIVDMIHYDGFISFINEIESGLAKPKPVEWTSGLSKVVSYFGDAQAWYNFLINLSGSLTSYPVQQSIVSAATFEMKNQIKKYTVDDQPVMKSLKQFLLQVVKGEAEKEFDSISHVKLDRFKLRFLNSMLDVDIHESCMSPNKLEITGQFIKLSDINKIEKKLKCEPIKTLEIFALKKVFIDSDFSKIGQKLQLVIVAPTWEVIGRPKIVLDGEEGKEHIPRKAPNAVGHGEDGSHGLPGLPGGAAGNFIGIGSHCDYCERLKITANGGQGGPGQSGGDGANGEPGRPGRVPRYKKNIFNIGIIKVHHDDTGYAGEPGGNGGNAGEGGIGGQPGEIKLIFNSESPRPQWAAEDGGHGHRGKGGAGGMGGLGEVSIESKTDLFGMEVWSNGNVYLEKRLASSGRDGSSSFWPTFNSDGQIEPEEKTTLENPSYSVNAYKASVRENFNKNALSSSLMKFLSLLENNESVRSLYDTSGLTDDLKQLENQFYALNKKISFAQFYKSLLERIELYAENPKDGEHSEQSRKVLAYLHLSTLSKICSLDNENNELVINMKDYLGQVLRDIDHLNDLITSMEINKKKTSYQRMIELKVNSASEFIKNEISTDIKKNIEDLDEQIGVLMDEISARKDKLLEAERRKLDDLLLKRTWLRILDVGRLVLDFFGMGLAGEAVVAGTIGMVKEELKLDENEDLEVDDYPIENPDSLNTFMARISDSFMKKAQSVVFKILGVEEKLKGLPDEGLPVELRDLKKNVEDSREELEAKIKSNASVDSDFVDKVYTHKQKTEELLQQQVEALETTKVPNDHLKQILTQSLNIMGMSENLLDGPQHAGDERLTKAVGNIKGQLATLELHERKIYEIIVPLCHKVRQMSSSLVERGRGQSQVALDMRKLGIQKTLLDVQDQIQRMSEGFEAQGPLLRSVEKLNFGMSTMIQLFDRIQEYLDRAELAAYIADVTSVKANSIQIDRKELQVTLAELKFAIHSNFVLSEYEKAMGAFGQAIFPFAHLYLAEYNLPPHLRSENTTRNLISTVVAQVSTLESRMQKKDLVIDGLQDAHIYRNIQFSSVDNKPPFFSWDHDTLGSLISELLSGNEITLHADITKGLDENAIKFNEIGLHFNLPNSVRAEEFYEALESYDIEMKHMGTSYYRCGEQFYVMTHEPLTIKHSLEKADVSGGYKGQNGVYEKIARNDPLLSPYTMWKIKLSRSDDDFSSLSAFKDEMVNLELEGTGQYVSHSIDDVVCNEDLEKYYTLDRSVNELNHVDLFDDPRTLAKNVVLAYRTEARKRRSVEDRNATASTVENSSLLSSAFQMISSLHQRIAPVLSLTRTTQEIPTVSPIPTPARPEPTLNIANESLNAGPITNSVDFGLVSTHGNLLLLDLLIRKRTGSKLSPKTAKEMIYSEQAHNLAYRAHVPDNDESAYGNLLA